MSAVVLAILVMLILSLVRMNVVLAIVIGAFVGGLTGGLSLTETIDIFSDGLGGSSKVALSYALLGAFAVTIAKTGLPNLLVEKALSFFQKEQENKKQAVMKILIIGVLLLMACMSQNIIPIHIAFIPILVPPLLILMNELQLDRRMVATTITFGLTVPYILLPFGFGEIFHGIVKDNVESNGLTIDTLSFTNAMLIPVSGMVLGLLLSWFFYRKNRTYHSMKKKIKEEEGTTYTKRSIGFAFLGIVGALAVQIYTENMIAGAVVGILIIYLGGAIKWREFDDVLTDGMKMMAFIGFVMLAASGFAEVLKATGDVEALVMDAASVMDGSKGVAAAVMLLVGLFVTLGIGSSFSTVPIIATIYVPLAMELGFSPMAILSLVGTAAALGDAGSPSSDSTLGPTSGLNVDGQHNHIWDSVVPTFIFYNIPLLIFGWVAAMVL